MKARKIATGLLRLSVLSIGGCVSGIALLALAQPDDLLLPAPTGPFRVGRTWFDWTDPDRLDPLAPADDIARRLPVWIWYPAMPTREASPAAYLPDAVRAALDAAASPLLRSTIGHLFTDQSHVRSHALDRPPVADGPFPVLLMRPLRGGLAPQYAVLVEDLASHGYIVVGADLPYTTRVAVFSDGAVAHRTELGAPSEFAAGTKSPLAPGLPNDLFLAVLDVLVDDGSFILDKLAELNSGTSGFAGSLDLDAVGAFGHSVGGTAALEFCARELRCRAGINIDGYIMGSVVEKGLDKPFLFISSDRPIWRRTDEERNDSEREMVNAFDRILSGLPNQTRDLILDGSGHFSFGDSALMMSPALGRLTGSLGTIDPARALAATSDYIRTFFDIHLQGRPESLLTDLAQDYPEVLENQL